LAPPFAAIFLLAVLVPMVNEQVICLFWMIVIIINKEIEIYISLMTFLAVWKCKSYSSLFVLKTHYALWIHIFQIFWNVKLVFDDVLMMEFEHIRCFTTEENALNVQ
jgi:hypothetical protein